jgi:uncharacterized glyoxalase superfamily protein PhnB
MTTAPRIYPTLRYADAKAAIDFLTTAFGFVASDVTEGEDGQIVHALVSYDTGVVMLSSRRKGDDPFDTGRTVLYVAVDDPDAHHDKAVGAGAEIMTGLVDQPYGSREYNALDPEGNIWCFGTYRPSAASGG